MSKWESNGNTICDEYGTPLARCYDDELDPQIACQIVREHNAHEELVGLLKSLRDAPYGLKLLHKLSEHACEGTIRDTWIPQINAVLARAEGRE